MVKLAFAFIVLAGCSFAGESADPGAGGSGGAPPDCDAIPTVCNNASVSWCIDPITGGPLCMLDACAPAGWSCSPVGDVVCCAP